MRKATLVGLALALAWFANGCGPTPNAIHAQITLEPAQKATCVVLQIQAATGGPALGLRKIDRAGKDVLNAAIFRGGYPKDVMISAEPRFGASGCTDPLFPNGRGAQQVASFPDRSFVDVTLALTGPAPADDVDGDGYTGEASGGPDCNDGDPGVHPGAPESCTDTIDSNCNRLVGCAEPACSGQTCWEPPAAIAFISAAQTRDAGQCSAAVNVEAQDQYGTPANVVVATVVDLAAAPSAGFGFYSDAACTTAIGQVSIAAGASSAAPFYFKGDSAGSVTVTASATGLTSRTQTEIIVPGNPTALVFETSEQTWTAGRCSGIVTAGTRDSLGNVAPVSSALTVDLAAAPATSFRFYSDAACTSQLTSTSVPASASTANFWFRGTTAGTFAVTASATGYTSASQNETIGADVPSRMAFTSAPQTVPQGECSTLTTFQVRDQWGNDVNVAPPTTVTLTGSASVTFYSDATCTTGISDVSLAAGQGAGQLYFMATTTGPATVTLTAAGLGTVDQIETIGSAGPSKLAFTSAPQTQTAGQCSAIVTIQSQDTNGNPANVTADELVTLSAAPAVGFTFYSDSGCTTPVTDVTILSGAQAASFYFGGTRAGTVSVTATGATLAAASQDETLVAGTQAHLAIITAAHSLTAGDCSATPLTIQTQDMYGNPATGASDVVVNLGHSLAIPGDFTFYGALLCGGGSISSATITAGTSSASVYLTGYKAGPIDVTVSAIGFSNVVQQQTVAAAAPSKVVVLGTPQSIQVDACSAAVTLQSQDAYGNPSAVSAGTTVDLSNDGTGVTMHDDGSCNSSGITGSVIATGTTTASFYFKGSSVQTFTITASVAGWSPDGTQVENITAQLPTQIVFTTSARTQTADTSCSAVVTVQSQDGTGAPSNVTADTVVNLTSNATAQWTFYSDAACGTPVTSVTIASGTNSQDFYFTGRVAETVTVTATTATLGNRTQDEIITAAAASKLRFTTAPMTLTAGACSASQVTVRSEDAYDNPVTVASDLAVALTSSDPSLKFYPDGTCGTQITSVTIPTGSATASFNIMGTARMSVTITAAAASYTDATQVETVDAATGTHLNFATAAQTLMPGACSGLTTIEALDAYNNRLSTAVTVTLSATAGFNATFYSDATCTTSIGTTLDIPVGPGAASFYFKAFRGGTMTITATAAGLTQATQDETLGSLARSGTCTLNNGSNSTTCTITPGLTNAALDTDILFFQATNGSSGTGSNSTVECWLSSTTQISCDRNGTNGTMNISWYVVEFPPSSGVLVQHLRQTCTTFPINLGKRIDPAQSFVLYSSKNNDGANGSRVPYKRADLSDDGTNSRVMLSYCAGTDNVALQVVQIQGAAVTRGSVSWTTSGTRTVSGLGNAPADRTFLFYTYDIPSTGDACARMVRGWLPSLSGLTNSITFERGNNSGTCNYAVTLNLNYERVVLPAGMTVQQVETSMGNGTATANAALTAVDTTRATAFTGGQTGSGQATGESANTTDGNPNYARARNVLSSSTALALTRGNTSNSARFTSYVVEWAVPP